MQTYYMTKVICSNLLKQQKTKKFKIYLITLDIEVGSDLHHFHLFLMLIVSF